MGYSPWSHKESNTTEAIEHARTHTIFYSGCVDLEIVIQSEVSQKEKNKYHIITHVCGI